MLSALETSVSNSFRTRFRVMCRNAKAPGRFQRPLRRRFRFEVLDLNRLGWLGSRSGSSGCAGLGVGFADIDASLEEGAIFDADAGCGDVAGERAFAADID